jgi:hypothetical protein
MLDVGPVLKTKGKMSTAASFSHSYAEARAKFRAAAREAGARISSFHNPAAAPAGAICESSGIAPADDDEALSADAAWIGPRGATRLIYVQSGTHGVEGFCGSGIQIGWLEQGLHRELPRDTALLLTHAVNPYGFAWQRRVTEDNVDLNRNFVDHASGHPTNGGYEALKEAICPPQWTAATVAAADRVLMGYAREHGPMALQAAITSGQYSHADGVFYGGRGETWSNRMVIELLRAHAALAKQVTFIDLHTGLGPYGVGEIMNNHAAGEPAFARVADWFGGEATSTDTGSSSSAPVSGDITLGVQRALPQADVTAVTLEYGTVSLKDVLDAVRADNWLHAHGDLRARQARDIKAQIRGAFYPEAADWKSMVFERSIDVLRRAAAGLAQS